MNKLIAWMLVCFVLWGCGNNDNSRRALNSIREEGEADTALPLLIDGGTKIVYQFGHMTPDKGLKLYYDTIPNPQGELAIDDSLRKKLTAR